MESRNQVKTNWMGDYYALIGNYLLHSDNGDTHSKLALQLISNGKHKDGSRMLCQYLETVIDVAVNKWLPADVTDDEKFHASLFPAVAPLYSRLGKLFLSSSAYNELQWSLLDTNHESDMESIQEIRECAFQNLKKARVIIAGIVLDGVPFMEEFGLHHHHHHHHHTHKQQTHTRTTKHNEARTCYNSPTIRSNSSNRRFIDTCP